MRMEHHPHGDRLSCIRESSAGTLQPCQDLEGADRKAGEGTFDRGMQRQDGGNGFKLEESRYQGQMLYYESGEITGQVVPLLGSAQGWRDGAVSHLVQLELSLPAAEVGTGPL